MRRAVAWVGRCQFIGAFIPSRMAVDPHTLGTDFHGQLGRGEVNSSCLSSHRQEESHKECTLWESASLSEFCSVLHKVQLNVSLWCLVSSMSLSQLKDITWQSNWVPRTQERNMAPTGSEMVYLLPSGWRCWILELWGTLKILSSTLSGGMHTIDTFPCT